CKTCGNAPTYPHLNQHQPDYATLCGRDTVQYKNADISQEILLSFLERNHIQYRTNLYMTMFRFREHRIVAFSGGRFLIHG
ncbi:molybdopterin biosynthesis protein MoeB, partial [Staphylococcus ureilyticus]